MKDLPDLPGSIHETTMVKANSSKLTGRRDGWNTNGLLPPSDGGSSARARVWARKNCFVDRSVRVPRAKPAAFVFQARCASKVPAADFEAAQRSHIEVAADHELYGCWHIAPTPHVVVLRFRC